MKFTGRYIFLTQNCYDMNDKIPQKLKTVRPICYYVILVLWFWLFYNEILVLWKRSICLHYIILPTANNIYVYNLVYSLFVYISSYCHDLLFYFQRGKTALDVAARGSYITIVDMILKAERYHLWKKVVYQNTVPTLVVIIPIIFCFHFHSFYSYIYSKQKSLVTVIPILTMTMIWLMTKVKYCSSQTIVSRHSTYEHFCISWPRNTWRMANGEN